MPYVAPITVEEALLAMGDGAMRVVAGCTDYFPSRKAGEGEPTLLDLTRVRALRGISETPQGWRIGATSTWTDILRAPLPPAFDALKLAAREVGSVQIQNLGTLAGNLCNASPAADGVPPLLALEAEVEIAARGSTRRIPLSRFITGVRSTDLQPGEIVTALHIPSPPDGTRSAFLKLGSRRYLVISIAMVAVNLTLRDGRIGDARVAVGACSPVATRLPALEAALDGVAVCDLADDTLVTEAHLAPLSPLDDVRGSASFRLHSVAELCRRAIRKAVGQEACHG